MKAIRRRLQDSAEVLCIAPLDGASQRSSHVSHPSGSTNAADQTTHQRHSTDAAADDQTSQQRPIASDSVSRSELDQLLALAQFSGFTPKAEMYIRQAIEQPQLLSEYLVTEVCRCLTGRACRQSDYTHNAAVLIHHIMQFLAKERHAVEPLDVTVATECRRLMPNTYNLRWADMRLMVYNGTWFLCELLERLGSRGLPTTEMTAALNDTFHMVVEAACKSADAVRTLQSL